MHRPCHQYFMLFFHMVKRAAAVFGSLERRVVARAGGACGKNCHTGFKGGPALSFGGHVLVLYEAEGFANCHGHKI